MVCIDELQTDVTEVTREKVKTKEPPSIIPLVTSAQLLIQTIVDTSTKFDTCVKDGTIEKK